MNNDSDLFSFDDYDLDSIAKDAKDAREPDSGAPKLKLKGGDDIPKSQFRGESNPSLKYGNANSGPSSNFGSSESDILRSSDSYRRGPVEINRSSNPVYEATPKKKIDLMGIIVKVLIAAVVIFVAWRVLEGLSGSRSNRKKISEKYTAASTKNDATSILTKDPASAAKYLSVDFVEDDSVADTVPHTVQAQISTKIASDGKIFAFYKDGKHEGYSTIDSQYSFYGLRVGDSADTYSNNMKFRYTTSVSKVPSGSSGSDQMTYWNEKDNTALCVVTKDGKITVLVYYNAYSDLNPLY